MKNENQQADGEIHEDQLLNFLVNALNGSFGVSFGDNADFETEDIYEVLVGAPPTEPRSLRSATGAMTARQGRTSFITSGQNLTLRLLARLETRFYRNTQLSAP